MECASVASMTEHCYTCNEPAQLTTHDDGESYICDTCWRDALAHGHMHGLHDDSNDSLPVPDCPLCPRPLYRCAACGYVTVYPYCARSPEHTVHMLTLKQANEYVRIGHDAFNREVYRHLPEPR